MRRIDEWMPLFISRYLADTMLLDNAMSGSYLHALMYEWVAGPLPNDMDQCARIMKMEGLGAADLAYALLKKFFEKVVGADGNPCWRQKRVEKIKEDFTARAIRYSQRSKRANESRWRGHVAKYPTRIPKPESAIVIGSLQVTPQGSLQVTPEGLPVVKELEVQRQNNSLRSLGSQPQAAGVISEAEKHLENGSKPNGHVKGFPARPKKPQDAPQAVQTAKSVIQGEKRAATRQSSRKTTPKNAVGTGNAIKPPVDPRFVPFRKEFKVYWKDLHPNGLTYTWDVEDGRALNNLLRKYKAMDFARYKSLLINRAHSDNINPSEAPARWLARLMEFSSGPLNEYSRPKADSAKSRGRHL